MKKTKKFDCYKCKYRGTIPGDAHSRCNHPEIKQDDNEFGALVEMLQGKATEVRKKLGIEGHPQGIRAGCFMWPASYDPTWLLSCNGFKLKENVGK